MATCSDQRSVYLITYSHADLGKINSREQFAEMWVKAFGENFVKQWACSCEKHTDGVNVHYHLALKLNRVKRWKIVRESVIRNTTLYAIFRNSTKTILMLINMSKKRLS